MTHKRLPKGAKQVSDWNKSSSMPTEKYSMGYQFGSEQFVFVEYEEAEVEYPNGNSTPIHAYATRVTVSRTNGTGLTRVYRQAYYGETADSDARREGNDHVDKTLYARA
jgi:hypothetical protein